MLKTTAGYLARAGIAACLLAQSGCGEDPKDTSGAVSAETSQPQTVAANLSHSSERPGLKRQKSSSTPREVSLWETDAPAVHKPSPLTARPTGIPAPTTALPGSASVAQGLLTRLTHLNLGGGRMSAEQATEVNQLLQQLREQGAAGVPAIREFLQRNEDVNFDALAGAELVDYSSLRVAMIDALHQIGGGDAAAAAAAALQFTTDPLEIALLSLTLEEQSSGEYRQIELAAANNALAKALSGNLKGGDMSALFETFQALGDTNVAPLLKQAASKWNYYATLALAGLPDGAGIPALIELARDPAVTALGSGDFALRPLAQVALQYPEAAQTLVQQARLNQIPDRAWPTVASSLAGTYIQYGNQIFGTTAPPTTWTPAEISQRIALINQLLATTPSPVGRQALQNAIASLSSRLPK